MNENGNSNIYCKTDDFEDYACKAEATWEVNRERIKKQDWAAPGKQY